MQHRGNTPGTVRTVLAKPGVECSPDLPRGLRRVSESAPISRRRVGRHRQRCSRPTRGGDSIYDKSLTDEPILPSRTANQNLARYWFAVRDGKIGSPVRDLSCLSLPLPPSLVSLALLARREEEDLQHHSKLNLNLNPTKPYAFLSFLPQRDRGDDLCHGGFRV